MGACMGLELRDTPQRHCWVHLSMSWARSLKCRVDEQRPGHTALRGQSGLGLPRSIALYLLHGPLRRKRKISLSKTRDIHVCHPRWVQPGPRGSYSWDGPVAQDSPTPAPAMAALWDGVLKMAPTPWSGLRIWGVAAAS